MPPYNGRYDPHNYHYPNYNSHVPHPPRPHIDWRHEQEDTGVKGVFDVSGVFDTVVSTVKSIVEEAAAGTTEETIILNESSDGYGSIDDINAIFGGNGNGRETVTDKILEETSDAVKEITEKSLIYERKLQIYYKSSDDVHILIW